jgi:ParB-like chromosome segregation protein Spo0J
MAKYLRKGGRQSDGRTSDKRRPEGNKRLKNSGKGTTEAKGPPEKPVQQLGDGDGLMFVRPIPIEMIIANDYNPNAMPEEDFREYVAEVRRLGMLPNPIVVRSDGAGGYIIVDGEHGLKAAKEVGLTAVPCQDILVDDFEAMRQSFKRNCHGTNDPVLLARMFKRMQEMQELSNRALAREIGISDGKLRNVLCYDKAAKLRTSCAPDKGDAQIARLTVEKVRYYCELPENERDAWLDAGADMPANKPADEATPPSTDTEASETATPAAAQEEAPQASADASNPVGPNPACPESPAPEAPTTQSVSSPGEGTQEKTPTGAQPASPGGKKCITLDLSDDPQDLAEVLVKGLGRKRAKQVSEAMTKLLNSRKDSQRPTHTNKRR